MAATNNGGALLLRSLPAEADGKTGGLAESVYERYRFTLLRQAGFQPYVTAAMILFSKFPEPARVLADMDRRGNKRVYY